MQLFWTFKYSKLLVLWQGYDLLILETINPLSANPTKWPNTLKQFASNLPTNCFGVFVHFVKLALKRLRGNEWKIAVNDCICSRSALNCYGQNPMFCYFHKQLFLIFCSPFHLFAAWSTWTPDRALNISCST